MLAWRRGTNDWCISSLIPYATVNSQEAARITGIDAPANLARA